jgi:hypothetical protein
LNTGVLAWMRVGQIYDLTQRHDLAVEAYKKAIAYAPEAAHESRLGRLDAPSAPLSPPCVSSENRRRAPKLRIPGRSVSS